ncbi:ABC transporter ATP-binding protein [Antarcticimicrobium luteum]|jgi:branched-chain amino acid transport system ATP-binding protein|uniref:ABC transporter ATP-binding protein n=1 Tax=Antarcticimicrobium luteum TaxID=2547397 RepID=A0A4R5VGE9_9RHOB|nr:ABC transporter ATP-binding protein [Antarcticimicrobium luteum]TDK50980.1 ABC transporter ATP-binding protein [Antarcticimicrobium luteum]
MSESILEVQNLEVFYGNAQAIHGISLTIEQGELLSLIGSNGAGKSTLFKSICGMVRPRSGTINFKGQTTAGLSPARITEMGIAMVPEGRRLFRSLSVEENLILGGYVRRPGPWTLQKVYDVFPILKERKDYPATSLSGGQQQMVAIGRALMSNPELLLLDELSLGLAPVVIKDIYELLPKILGEGMATILVEQDVTRAMQVSDHFVCMLEGRISLSGQSDAFSHDEISAAYFGT